MRYSNNSVEQDTRVLINHTLENLGWKLKGKGKNVFFEKPKTENERRKLDGKHPDYVLYSGSKPLIVIEAKRAGAKIDAALEQGIGYARVLNAPLVFATDGVFCKSFHTFANRTPILNGEEIDEFIRESLALRFLNSYEVNTISSKVQYDRKELISIFDEANNMLRGDGLRAGIERFGEFANILFLKLISENEQLKQERNMPSLFDISSCGWDVIRKIPLSARIEYINNVYVKLNNLYQTEIFTPLIIRDATILEDIMDKLDPLTLTDVDSDVKGDAFEYFLRASTSTKNDLGEYFTPRHIVKTMVRLVNPKLGEKIYDPFCGTGGFLIETFRYIERSVNSKHPDVRKTLTEQTIFGNEITNTARITKMNMILAGDGHSNIHMCDSLANPTYIDKVKYDKNGKILRDDYGNIVYSSEYSGIYDVVITNMPYSQRTRYGNLYDLPSTNGDSICVQHCIKAINSASENGRMALIVPEGFLFRKDLTKVREYLLSRCQLQSIISLPQGVFLPYTGVKTDIIYATKVNQKIKHSDFKKNFWYFEVKNDGYTLDNHRRKQDRTSDLAKYEEYRKLDESQSENMLKVGFEIVSIDEVQKNSFILVGSRYRKTQNISKIATVSFSNFATIIRGVNYKKYQQTTFRTRNVILTADNITLSGELAITKEIFVDNAIDFPSEKRLQKNDIFICMSSGSKEHIGKVAYIDEDLTYYAGGFMGIIRTNPHKCLSKYLYYYLLFSSNYKEKIKTLTQGANIYNINNNLNDFEIPLPSLEEQKKIVSELESYQKIIEGARTIVDSYSPTVNVKNFSKIVKLRDIFDFVSDTVNPLKKSGMINYIGLENVKSGTGEIIGNIANKYEEIKSLKRIFKPNDILFGKLRPALNKVAFVDFDGICSTDFLVLRAKDTSILSEFYSIFFRSADFNSKILNGVGGGQLPRLDPQYLLDMSVPIVSVSEQENAINQIHLEKSLIESSKNIIETFSKKITTKMKEILGE